MKDKEYEEELERLRLKRLEVLKVKPDIEESDPTKTRKDWFWEGWIDFDIGTVMNNVNMVSIKVAGDQRVIADKVVEINKQLVGSKLSRHVLEKIKKYLIKNDIEVLDEKWSRKTSEETGIK